MRNTATFMVLLAAAGGAARADQLTINKMLYSNVKVVDTENCRISYQLQGRGYEKPVGQVTYMNLMGRTALNQAEDLVKAGKPADAIVLYDRAFTGGEEGWLKRLIRHRRLRALDAARMTGRAVEDWLAIVDENSASRASIELAPAGLGKRRSAGNTKAIKLLEGRLKDKNIALLGRIKRLLRDLYTVEGASEKIALLDGMGGADNGGKNGNGTGGTPMVAPSPVSVGGAPLSGQLREAQDQINAGQYAAAADSIKARLRRYPAGDLPAALLLRGKALLLMYEKGSRRERKTLLEAGLCFMRIAACVDLSEEQVPEATFLAAKVCEHLGNKVAAANTYRMLVNRHPGSEWARKAQAALGG